MRAKTFAILERAVEEGVLRGYHRAHKHVEWPSPEHLRQAIQEAVMGEICEVFSFEEEVP